MREQMTVYFQPEVMEQVSEWAIRKKIPKASVVEAAVLSFLSPDGSDRQEAAFSRRLDRLTRQSQRLERNISISADMMALFIQFYLTMNPPLPEEAQNAAHLSGQKRYEAFIELLGQRLQAGRSILTEIPMDYPQAEDSGKAPS